MSGPNDSGIGELRFPSFEAAAPLEISPRFRLGVNWRTPHLEWLPKPERPTGLGAASLWQDLDDPEAAVEATVRYFGGGGFYFDLFRPNWLELERVWTAAPTVPRPLLPTFAEMRAMREDGFFCLSGAMAPFASAPPPSPFFKLPDPPPAYAGPSLPRKGSVGDIFTALDGVRPIHELKTQAVDKAKLILPRLERDWKSMTIGEKIPAFTLSATFAVGLVGGALMLPASRHLLFQQLEGMKIPAPYVPGTTVAIDGFGKWDRFLLGPPSDPRKPQELRFTITVDLVEAVPALVKWLK